MRKNLLLVVVAIIALPIALSQPALANKKATTAKTGGGLKNELSLHDRCELYWGLMRAAEAEADKHAGTPAAGPFSDEADHWWQTGVNLGCWKA